MVPDADDDAEFVPSFAGRVLYPGVRSDLQWRQRMCRSIVVLLRLLENFCCFGVAFLCLLLPLSSERAAVSGDTGSDAMSENHLCWGTSISSRRVPQLQKSSVEFVIFDATVCRRLGYQVLHRLHCSLRMSVGLWVVRS